MSAMSSRRRTYGLEGWLMSGEVLFSGYIDESTETTTGNNLKKIIDEDYLTIIFYGKGYVYQYISSDFESYISSKFNYRVKLSPSSSYVFVNTDDNLVNASSSGHLTILAIPRTDI